jgi:hypothetical protein
MNDFPKRFSITSGIPAHYNIIYNVNLDKFYNELLEIELDNIDQLVYHSNLTEAKTVIENIKKL